MTTIADPQAAYDIEEATQFRQLTAKLVAAVRQHQQRRVELRAAFAAARKARKQADEDLSLFLEGIGSRDALPDTEFLRRCGELTRAAESAQQADTEARQEYALAVSNTRRAQLELRLACSRRFQREPLFEFAARQAAETPPAEAPSGRNGETPASVPGGNGAYHGVEVRPGLWINPSYAAGLARRGLVATIHLGTNRGPRVLYALTAAALDLLAKGGHCAAANG